MKTIIVATDFSATSTNAVNYAVEMAMVIEADLLLLHVCPFPVSYAEIPVAVSSTDLIQDAEKNISLLRDTIIRKNGNKVYIETDVKMGIFLQELKNVCEKVKPHAVVIGSQGKNVAERLLLGGHAVDAMKNLPWPLVSVPLNVKYNSIKNIGLATDLDHVSETVPVDEIKQFVKEFDASLHVLHTGYQQSMDASTKHELNVLQKMLDNLQPSYHYITNDDIDDGIISFVDKRHIDLLIVLPKRHSLLDKLIYKSNTRQFVLHSHVPVMALHSVK
jgi:nucleotide-binding universal stress UspA family protein